MPTPTDHDLQEAIRRAWNEAIEAAARLADEPSASAIRGLRRGDPADEARMLIVHAHSEQERRV